MTLHISALFDFFYLKLAHEFSPDLEWSDGLSNAPISNAALVVRRFLDWISGTVNWLINYIGFVNVKKCRYIRFSNRRVPNFVLFLAAFVLPCSISIMAIRKQIMAPATFACPPEPPFAPSSVCCAPSAVEHAPIFAPGCGAPGENAPMSGVLGQFKI